MHKFLTTVAALATVLSAQEQPTPTAALPTILPGSGARVLLGAAAGIDAEISRDGGRTWTALQIGDPRLALRCGVFDPRVAVPIPDELRAATGGRLHIVQFATSLIPEYRTALAHLGAEVHSYLPHQAYLIRADANVRAAIESLGVVRAVIPYHPGIRLEPEIIFGLGTDPAGTRRYNIVLVDKKTDAIGLEAEVVAIGGRVEVPASGGLLVDASLNEKQLLALAADDRVAWIDRSSPPERDIDNARLQGGVDYIETMSGIDGKGMRGHVMEGVHSTHVEFAALLPYRGAPIAVQDAASSSHGTNTAGEIYGRGARTDARGLLPFAQMLYTNYNHVYNNNSRYSLTKDLVDPLKSYRAMFQTASWGYGVTTEYTSRSAEMDDIIFEFDLFVTQSQSNTGDQRSRPQAWAKNITSVGGFRHYNNSNPADDAWANTGSTGPAADGRIGVTLAAYYDSILTTSGGASSYTTGFGGTSGATPIINGLGGNAIQMFTEGMFGYSKSRDWQSRFAYLPHATTTKALLVATARQLAFNRSNRYQQGFGFPSLATLHDERDRLLVIDELDVLRQGQSRTYFLWVPPGTAEFHAAMNHSDPAALPTARIHRVNSVDLAVRFDGGPTYLGNNGLLTGSYSTAGGLSNDLDTEESVIVQNPPAGLMQVTVAATAVRQDSHVETTAADVDYALVVRGAGGLRDTSGLHLDVTSTRPGALEVRLKGLPATFARGYTLFSLDTTRPVSTGNLTGLELDALAGSLLVLPAGVGDVFHFLATQQATAYPNAAFVFPPAIALAVQGKTLDAVVLLVDAAGHFVSVSNVARVQVK